jgi:hypothetical protein
MSPNRTILSIRRHELRLGKGPQPSSITAGYFDSNLHLSINHIASIARVLGRPQKTLEHLDPAAARVLTEMLPSVRRQDSIVVYLTSVVSKSSSHQPKEPHQFRAHRQQSQPICQFSQLQPSLDLEVFTGTVEHCVQPLSTESMLDLKLKSRRAKACLSYRKPW